MHKITESQIQRGVLDYLEMISKQKNIYYFRSASGQVKTDSGRVFRTGKPGCPDITLCINGKFIGIELKTPTGKMSELQKIAKQEIESAGGCYFIVRGMEDIVNVIKKINEQ